MAVPTRTDNLDTLYSSTWNRMREESVDNIFSSTPLLYWLYDGGRIRREDGGRWIGVQLMYGKNTTVKSIGPGGSVGTDRPEIVTTAQYDWKFVAGSITRLFAEETWNRGKSQIYNRVKSDLKNLELSLIDALETMLHGDGSGNGGLDMNGLKSLVASTPTNTVGGLLRTTYLWWKNQQRAYDESDMLPTDTGMRHNFAKVYNLCSVGNDHPTMMLGDTATFEKYEASLAAKVQLTKTKLGDAGFDALAFKGCPVTYSPAAEANTMRFLNERYLELVINSAADFIMTPWKDIPDQVNDRIAQVLVEGELVTSNARMQGVLYNIP